MAMPGPEIEALIRAALPDAEIRLTDLAGDDNHWAAHVRSARFSGLSRVKQHKLVYDAIGPRMGGELHALQLTTEAVADGQEGPEESK